ncbi:MAG: prepilin peptidase [Thermoguttaceae bacterium]
MTTFEIVIWAVWLTFFGGAVGSFLNVVVYRLPRGESLISPPSHCPKCGHHIRFSDNVPVVGWIFLGGRCRDCRAAISVRYPLVEAAVAAIFGVVGLLVLTFCETCDTLTLISIIAAAVAVPTTLLAVGLIVYDRRR